MAAGFKVYVDWDNNGDFTGTYDDISEDVRSLKFRNGFRSPFQEVADENSAEIVVDNQTGKYNPENATGVLYGNLLPHRRMSIQFYDGISTYTTLWTGWIEFPESGWSPAGAYTAKTTSVLYGVGAKTYMDTLEIETNLYYTNTTGDVIIEDLLTATGLTTISTDFTQIETGLTVLDYFGDQGTEKGSIYALIKEVTKAERGRFYVDRSGRGVWYNRHHFILDTVNDATVNDSSGNYKPNAVNYTYGSTISNIVRVSCAQRQVGTPETLWQLDQSYSVPGGTIRTITIRLRKSTGQFAASGTLTATPTFSSGTCTVTIDERGGMAIITLNNSANATPAVLSALVVAGAPTIEQNQITIEVSDGTSISTYGKRGYNIDLGAIANLNDPLYVGQFELNRRKDARGDIGSIAYTRKADASDNAHLLVWGIGTRLGITLLNGHTGNYFIIGEEHQWSPNDVHRATFFLESALTGTSTGGFWLLGVSGAGELGTKTILGY